jgi:hypothetical protein
VSSEGRDSTAMVRCQFSQSLFGMRSAIGLPVVCPCLMPLQRLRPIGFDGHPAAAPVAGLTPAQLRRDRIE